jgi:hypothetical protein
MMYMQCTPARASWNIKKFTTNSSATLAAASSSCAASRRRRPSREAACALQRASAEPPGRGARKGAARRAEARKRHGWRLANSNSVFFLSGWVLHCFTAEREGHWNKKIGKIGERRKQSKPGGGVVGFASGKTEKKRPWEKNAGVVAGLVCMGTTNSGRVPGPRRTAGTASRTESRRHGHGSPR